MAKRIAGTATVYADGRQLPLRGNFMVSPTKYERTGMAGQDFVHGYSEMPRVPFIEGDITLADDVSIDDLDGLKDVTVVANLANGWNYTLREAWTASTRELNTREGQTKVRFEGVDMDEYRSG